MTAHAILGPSKAHRWMTCAASIHLEAGIPDTSSEFADEGTAAHELGAMCLTEGTDAKAYLGRIIRVGEREFTVDEDMAGHVQTYVDTVRSMAAGHELMVEQRVEFSDVVGVPDQFGTSDAVVLCADGEEIQVHDLKYGRGVKVDAFVVWPDDGREPAVHRPNEQMALYALGAIEEFGMVGDFKRARLVIHQPRLDHVSEHVISVDDLREFAARAKAMAAKCMDIAATGIVGDEDYSPSDKGCRFCKAKATCPALAAKVQQDVGADFEQIAVLTESSLIDMRVPKLTDGDLAKKMAAVDLIEQFCKAVRAETERRLLAGTPVKGWKLVQGRRGSRAWADAKAAEEALKTMRLKQEQMYDFTLISPTTAEKLAKAGDIGPRQWPKLQSLITQSEGKPSVAPESDKRQALEVKPVAEDFAPVVDTAEEGLV